MSQLPKAPPTCRRFVYDHVVSVVDGPDYHPNLPPLSDDWDDSDPEENRRFEWLGDSALAIRMSLKIYEMCPGAKVEFYDLVRGILLSNDVQTHIMQKIGTPGDFPSQKSTADAFEMLVGASYTENLYHDQGMAEDFHNWFDDMFTPLVQAAEAAHRTFEQWKVDCEFARVRAGGVPLAPHIPKRKKHSKVLNAVRVCRYRHGIEEKRKQELARRAQRPQIIMPPVIRFLPSRPISTISSVDLEKMRWPINLLGLEISTLCFQIRNLDPNSSIYHEIRNTQARMRGFIDQLTICVPPQDLPLGMIENHGMPPRHLETACRIICLYLGIFAREILDQRAPVLEIMVKYRTRIEDLFTRSRRRMKYIY